MDSSAHAGFRGTAYEVPWPRNSPHAITARSDNPQTAMGTIVEM
jgi:hypothetical protein